MSTNIPSTTLSPKVIKEISLEKEKIIRNVNITKYPLMIINITIYVIILVYLFQMNSKLCQCSSSWKKEFIKFFCFYAILRSILSVIFFENLRKELFLRKSLIALVVVDALLFISFLIITLTYISQLKKEKCFCSKNWKREFTWVLSWIMVGLLSIAYSWIIIALPIIILTLLNRN